MASITTTPNVKIIQNLEKKAFNDLDKPAIHHGIALISSLAFLTIAIVSSMLALPTIVTYSSLGICQQFPKDFCAL